jgi:hypothetical protein
MRFSLPFERLLTDRHLRGHVLGQVRNSQNQVLYKISYNRFYIRLFKYFFIDAVFGWLSSRHFQKWGLETGVLKDRTEFKFRNYSFTRCFKEPLFNNMHQ